MPGAVFQGLEASASLGDFFPSPHSQLQDDELIGLESPTERHEVISAVQVRRLPPALLNRPVQPPSVAEGTKSSIATARMRSIARSPSQPTHQNRVVRPPMREVQAQAHPKLPIISPPS